MQVKIVMGTELTILEYIKENYFITFFNRINKESLFTQQCVKIYIIALIVFCIILKNIA